MRDALTILENAGGWGHVPSVEELEVLAIEAGCLDPVTDFAGNNEEESRDKWLFFMDGSYLTNPDPEMGEAWEACNATPGEIVELEPDYKGRRFGMQWTGTVWVTMRGEVSVTWIPYE